MNGFLYPSRNSKIYGKRNLVFCEQISPVPWPIVISRLHCNINPIKIPYSFLKPGRSVSLYSSQKEIVYISASTIAAAVETHPPQSHNLLYFSPSLPSLTFYGPLPPSLASRFCDTRISSILGEKSNFCTGGNVAERAVRALVWQSTGPAFNPRSSG